MRINFTTQIWQEGNLFVSYAPELDISSCGKTVEEAEAHLQEAVEGFVEAAQDRGTLEEVLEEAGFTRQPDTSWSPRQVLATQRMHLAI